MINRVLFFADIKKTLFPKIAQSQVMGIDVILNEWEVSGFTDLRWLAYMLSTSYHETARTMRPIEEYGKGKGRKYGIPDPKTGFAYYGRGLVQLTWNYNYIKMGKILGVDLYHEPELALTRNIATKIMFEGMTKGASTFGDFTGKSLENYFNSTTEDWVNARKIINGLDMAQAIAGYSKSFYNALSRS